MNAVLKRLNRRLTRALEAGGVAAVVDEVSTWAREGIA